MRSPKLAPSIVRLAACLAASLGVAGCKVASSKTEMGPFHPDRYEVTAADGNKIFCYVFGADTNKPARLCGDGAPTPDRKEILFSAVAGIPGSDFVEKVGEPLEPGFYLIKPIGTDTPDVWPLGKLGMHEWIAGKRLLAVDTDEKHVTHVRVLDPTARADRSFETPTTTSEFLLVRAENDLALLLVQKNGGEEILLLEHPVENPILSVSNVSDGKSAGNRKLFAAGSVERLQHKVWTPPTGFYGRITWQGTKPLYDGAPLGPFEETK